LEQQVSEHVGDMSILWVNVDDEPGPDSERAFIERSVIALLATVGRHDSPSPDWLGRYSARQEIRESGLWNLNHLGASFDNKVFDVLERCVRRTIEAHRR